MKILTLAAAAAAAMLAIPAASAATAAPPAATSVMSFTASTSALLQDRGRWDRDDRGRSYERRHRRSAWRTVCTRKWRHGHRTRVCRKIRYWR